jgi:hypothetical protein
MISIYRPSFDVEPLIFYLYIKGNFFQQRITMYVYMAYQFTKGVPLQRTDSGKQDHMADNFSAFTARTISL